MLSGTENAVTKAEINAVLHVACGCVLYPTDTSASLSSPIISLIQICTERQMHAACAYQHADRGSSPSDMKYATNLTQQQVVVLTSLHLCLTLRKRKIAAALEANF